MSSRTAIRMSVADVEAHQRRHGFIATVPPPVIADIKAKFSALRKSKEPNKTEAEFGRRLQAEFKREPIFEAFKIRIAGNCYYAPDWTIWMDGKLWFFEVKGAHIWDDSKVKFKAAKERYPYFEFEMWQKKVGSWRRIL